MEYWLVATACSGGRGVSDRCSRISLFTLQVHASGGTAGRRHRLPEAPSGVDCFFLRAAHGFFLAPYGYPIDGVADQRSMILKSITRRRGTLSIHDFSRLDAAAGGGVIVQPALIAGKDERLGKPVTANRAEVHRGKAVFPPRETAERSGSSGTPVCGSAATRDGAIKATSKEARSFE
jgi:hypothetical protein